MCKVALAQVLHDIIQRALHVHGSLGTTRETPLGEWWGAVPNLALADGPTEVHKTTVARLTLRTTPRQSAYFLDTSDAARNRPASGTRRS